jgi:hypothetical protein
MTLAKLFRTGGGNHASFYSRNPCRCGDDLFQCARRCIGADCNNSKRRWTLLDIIGAVGARTGAIPAQGARYEDTCVDRCIALDRLAGRRAATATTGAWCGRPDKHLDPSKQRPLYVLKEWLRLSATNPPARTSRATDRAPRLRDRAPRLEPAPPPDRALGPELLPSQAVV